MRVFLGMLVLAMPAFAQERTHDVKPEDYFTLNTITEIAVSPDGKHVAYGVGTCDKVEYGHGVRKVSEIHKLDLNSWQTTKVIDETRYIREFAVTIRGDKLALVSAFDDTVVKSEGESRVDIWEAGKVTTPPTDAYRK